MRFAIQSAGLLVICVVSLHVNAEDTKANGECNFEAYRPLEFAPPIRGGHESLAIEKVYPAYPPEAQQKGIEGRVVVKVLINRAGSVVKACGAGPALWAASAQTAVSKWKFQKDFGLGFVEPSTAGPQYAVLSLSFDFSPKNDGRGRDAKPSGVGWACAEGTQSAADGQGVPIWLRTDDLMRRVVKKWN